MVIVALVDVFFQNGQTVQADCVVAADGVGSALRQQLVGDTKQCLGLSCVVGHAEVEVSIRCLLEAIS
jgi:2-polyprenyl-6-methoxyphenol hydroxylase-like FAD-dependent oxidoreductase